MMRYVSPSRQIKFTKLLKDLTPSTSTQPPESPNPTIYSSMKAQSAFHVTSNYISNRLLLHGFVSPGDALSMNTTLDNWVKGLPGYFQLGQDPQNLESWYIFARARLYWRLWNFKIILLRQILMRQVMKRHGEFLPTSPFQKQRDAVAFVWRRPISPSRRSMTIYATQNQPSWYFGIRRNLPHDKLKECLMLI